MIKLIQGDCLEKMKDISDGSIDLTVTSPEYDNLRTYNGNNDQWGERVWKGCIDGLWRITKPGGVVVWVVGDATIDGSETLTSCYQKIYFKEVGFNIHDTMIYQKHNFSNPSNNRYHQIFEYMFVLSKGAPKTWNPIKDRKNICAGKIGSWGKNTVRQPDGSFKERKRKINTEYGQRYNIWQIVTHNKKTEHPAPFPEQLPHDHIITWTNPGDLVFDPMMGWGTTGQEAVKLGRDFMGIELDPEYFKLAEKRIASSEKKELIGL